MRRLTAALLLVGLVGCGARSSLDVGDAAGRRLDGGTDADRPRDAGPDGSFDGGLDAGCVPLPDGCLAREVCGNGANDDCDDRVDEGCGCEPGSVQPCFLGAPGRRDVGACQDGAQTCTGDGTWGACQGGVLPNAEVCTGRDDLCDGCSDQRSCMIDCPNPGDPRVPLGRPFERYPLDAAQFYRGPAAGFRWQVSGGPCDGLAPNLASFELLDGNTANAVLIPNLSGEYRVTLEVTLLSGERLRCSWVVTVSGPGLRIEMCYPESESLDLDLFVHDPRNREDWYVGPNLSAFSANPDASCGWHTCEALVRQPNHPATGVANERADWGYDDSPLSACSEGPQGANWADRGSCANPRLDIDNNLSAGTGVPENINIDAPRQGQTFRIMVQNFSGAPARPLVNVYCAGRRVATYGQAPDVVTRFEGTDGNRGIGAMWRVADVTTGVGPDGQTTCEVEALHPDGADRGYRVTYDDPRY